MLKSDVIKNKIAARNHILNDMAYDFNAEFGGCYSKGRYDRYEELKAERDQWKVDLQRVLEEEDRVARDTLAELGPEIIEQVGGDILSAAGISEEVARRLGITVTTFEYPEEVAELAKEQA